MESSSSSQPSEIPSSSQPSMVLLVLVNVEPRHILRELNLFCYRTGWTLVLCYSAEEAAEYLENLHISRYKNEQCAVNAIQERKRKRLGLAENYDEFNQAVSFLTAIRSVTTTDAQRLLATFGSVRKIANADIDRLLLCPGLGPTKAGKIHAFFRASFRRM
ncbi:unnamed protein product [Gongylonema pulchrum]|uniref:HHH_2 domain-containing protein n=1 Tax=Gongylonema pulchrum TaxID=637853 RepID=A0A183EAK4_9BILA|nr:unnamed protein product [Gongylonema pulchrum]